MGQNGHINDEMVPLVVNYSSLLQKHSSYKESISLIKSFFAIYLMFISSLLSKEMERCKGRTLFNFKLSSNIHLNLAETRLDWLNWGGSNQNWIKDSNPVSTRWLGSSEIVWVSFLSGNYKKNVTNLLKNYNV